MEKMRLNEVSAERALRNTIDFGKTESKMWDMIRLDDNRKDFVCDPVFIGEHDEYPQIEFDREDYRETLLEYLEKNKLDAYYFHYRTPWCFSQKPTHEVIIRNDLNRYDLENTFNLSKAVELYMNFNGNVDDFEKMLDSCFYSNHKKKYDTQYIYENLRDFYYANGEYFEYAEADGYHIPETARDRVAFYFSKFCYFFSYEVVIEKNPNYDFFYHTYPCDFVYTKEKISERMDSSFFKYGEKYIDKDKTWELYKHFFNTMVLGYPYTILMEPVYEGEEINYENHKVVTGGWAYAEGAMSFAEFEPQNFPKLEIDWSQEARDFNLLEKLNLKNDEFEDFDVLECAVDLKEIILSEDQQKIYDDFLDDTESYIAECETDEYCTYEDFEKRLDAYFDRFRIRAR